MSLKSPEPKRKCQENFQPQISAIFKNADFS